MEQKVWIDVKILRFFIKNAIQYIGVIGYSVKPFDNSNIYKLGETLKSCDSKLSIEVLTRLLILPAPP
jgi:hypothetical protein